MLNPSVSSGKTDSALCDEINDLINAVLGDLRAFKSEGYPIYQGQVKKANTGDSEDLKSILKIVHQMIDDLDEFKSENVPAYRKCLKKFEDILGC